MIRISGKAQMVGGACLLMLVNLTDTVIVSLSVTRFGPVVVIVSLAATLLGVFLWRTGLRRGVLRWTLLRELGSGGTLAIPVVMAAAYLTTGIPMKSLLLAYGGVNLLATTGTLARLHEDEGSGWPQWAGYALVAMCGVGMCWGIVVAWRHLPGVGTEEATLAYWPWLLGALAALWMLVTISVALGSGFRSRARSTP